MLAPKEMQRSVEGRFQELDGIRAIACLLVVLHHSFTLPVSQFVSRFSPSVGKLLFHTTASGVECFFCLSGFILLYPYFRGEKTLCLSTYCRKRFFRLYPPFVFAWLAAGLTQYVATGWPTWFSHNMDSFSMTDWLGQLNLFTLLSFETLYNGVWWSLAIECFWYTLVPVIVRLHSSLAVVRGSLFWLLCTLGSVAAAFAIDSGNVFSSYELFGMPRTVATFLSFSACFSSAVWLLIYTPDLRVVFGAGLVGLGLLSYCVIANDFRGVHSGFGLAWSSMIGLCMRIPRFKAAMSIRPLVWLGDRSYSLFLTHMTVFVFVNWVVSHWCTSKTLEYGLITRAIGLPLALYVAMVLFWRVERHCARGLATAGMFWPPLSTQRPAARKS
jgi:peptidoglycan/LPS O-acetylase OafA/YrhL